jgi:ABC-type multidrug transport system fused ATPase/permease subunit
VAARDVTFRFDAAERPALEDAELVAQPGRVVAVVGPTGSGKSALLALAARLYDPEAGTLSLDGVPLADVAGLRGQVAAAFQEAFLFDDTVRDNITLGEPFRDEELVAAAELAQADAFVHELPHGYDTLVGERGTSLSGGQRQRIALARALVRRPRLLLLDDATSSVDPSVEARILAGLRQADLPSTVITVAQRMATIAAADEVVYLERGRVVAHGRHDELLEVPGYRAIVQAASAGGSPR